MGILTIADVRAKFPQYESLSDGDLANAIHTKYYSGMDRGEFDNAIGFKGELATEVPAQRPDIHPASAMTDFVSQAQSLMVPEPTAPNAAPVAPTAPIVTPTIEPRTGPPVQTPPMGQPVPPVGSTPSLPQAGQTSVSTTPIEDVVNSVLEAGGVPSLQSRVAAGEGVMPFAPGQAMPTLPLEPTAPNAAPVEVSPFDGESFGDLAGRRGQQFARGATEVFASVPESVAIAGRNITMNRLHSVLQAQPVLAKEYTELNSIISEFGPDSIQGRAAVGRLNAVEGELIRAERMASEDLSTTERPVEETQPFLLGGKLRDVSGEFFGTPDPRDQSFWGKLFEGGGNMTAMAVTSVAASLVGGPVAGLTVGAAEGSAMNTSQLYKEARDAGATEEDAMRAAEWGALIGASEIVPIGRALKLLPPRLRQKIGGAVMKRFADVAQGAGEEAAQEYLATVANNIVASNIFDPDRGWTEGATEAALIGAILGGGIGAVGSAVGGDKGAAAATPPKPQTGDKEPDAKTDTPTPPQFGTEQITPETGEVRTPDMKPAEATEAPAQPATPEQVAEPIVEQQPDQPAPSLPVGVAPEPKPNGGSATAPEGADAQAQVDPKEWQELPGVAGAEETGRTFMENTRTGEVIPKAEFDARNQSVPDTQAPLTVKDEPQAEPTPPVAESLTEQRIPPDEAGYVPQGIITQKEANAALPDGVRAVRRDPQDNTSWTLLGDNAKPLGTFKSTAPEGLDPDTLKRMQDMLDARETPARVEPAELAKTQRDELDVKVEKALGNFTPLAQKNYDFLASLEGGEQAFRFAVRDGHVGKTLINAEIMQQGHDDPRTYPKPNANMVYSNSQAKPEDRFESFAGGKGMETAGFSVLEVAPGYWIGNTSYAIGNGGGGGPLSLSGKTYQTRRQVIDATVIPLLDKFKAYDGSDNLSAKDKATARKVVSELEAWLEKNSDDVSVRKPTDAEKSSEAVLPFVEDMDGEFWDGGWPSPKMQVSHTSTKGGGVQLRLRLMRDGKLLKAETDNYISPFVRDGKLYYLPADLGTKPELKELVAISDPRDTGKPVAKGDRRLDLAGTHWNNMSVDKRAEFMQSINPKAKRSIVDKYTSTEWEGLSGQLQSRFTKAMPDSVFKAQETKETTGPSGMKVNVNVVGRDGKTDAERYAETKRLMKEDRETLWQDPEDVSTWKFKGEGKDGGAGTVRIEVAVTDSKSKSPTLKDISSENGELTVKNHRESYNSEDDVFVKLEPVKLTPSKADILKAAQDSGRLEIVHVDGKPKPSDDLDRFETDLRDKHELQNLSMFVSKGNLKLNMISVDKDKRGAGVGSAAMKDITDFADSNGLKIVLSPALKDDSFGTTSRSRLIKFYKRFGFVENKGRNKDFEISEGMYREPVAVANTPSSDQIEAEAAQADTAPTDDQKEAGNYKMGHISWMGLDITIENAKGSERSGTDSDGEKWSVTMPAHYGYIKRTEGADGDHVDIYMGEYPESAKVFVIDQVNLDRTFDEHKVMLGFRSNLLARSTHAKAFSDGLGEQRRGGVTEMTVSEFREWLEKGDQSKPLSKDFAGKEQTDAAPKADKTPTEPEFDPYTVEGWRDTVIEVEDEDGSTVTMKAGEIEDIIAEREDQAKQLLRCLNG